MSVSTDNLPTHLASVTRRLNVTGNDASADTFLAASYVSESLLKTIAIVLLTGKRRGANTNPYKFEYDLVRADGLPVRLV